MRQRKFGFTLAEVMIVLSVIGILSAVLMPIAFKSSPDKNIMKFKKAHNTINTAIRELVSNGKYYLPGTLGKTPDGNYACAPLSTGSVDGTYFCKALSDVISAKSTNCTDTGCTAVGYGKMRRVQEPDELKLGIFTKTKTRLDAECYGVMYDVKDALGNSLVTTDNVLIQDIGPAVHAFTLQQIENQTREQSITEGMLSNDGFDISYYPLCVDIDGDGPIKPFAYGIREDGHILTSARVDWWLERDINSKGSPNEKPNCCPKAISQATTFNDAVTYNLCDEGDTVCTE